MVSKILSVTKKYELYEAAAAAQTNRSIQTVHTLPRPKI